MRPDQWSKRKHQTGPYYAKYLKPRACEFCGETFQPRAYVHKWCSTRCKGWHKRLMGPNIPQVKS